MFSVGAVGDDSEESRELIREKGLTPYIPRKKTQTQGVMIGTGDYINTGIWSKMSLHASNTSEQLQQDMTN